MSTPLPTYTGALLVLADSISSVYDTAGSQSWSNYIATKFYYDNREMDITATGGWTVSDLYSKRTEWALIANSTMPTDVVIWAGTNDLASGDTARPGDVTANLQLLIAYVKTLSGVRNIFVVTCLPRGVVGGGTTLSFEAKRAGQDAAGAALPGYVNGTVYSSATPSWILVSNGTNTFLMRCTTGGTAATASPAWSFTLGGTTSAGGGVVFTCYGRVLNEWIRNNAAGLGYTCIDIGADAGLGVYANLGNTSYYLDQIHPTQTQQISVILPYFTPYFDQGGSSDIPYRTPVVNTVTPSSAACGSPISLAMVEVGKMDATHPCQINGADCTSVIRQTDLNVTCVTPTSLSAGNTYSGTYKRTDGQTATFSFTCVQPVITVVAAGSQMSVSALTLPSNLLNSVVINISVNNGGGYGATAATFNGISLTGVTYSADGSTVTGTLPAGTYSASTGSVTVTSPSSPTALSSSATFGTVTPTTNYTTDLMGFGDPGSIQGTTTCTGWNDNTSNANNLGANASPAINATSANFTQGGTGIKTVSLVAASSQYLNKAVFTANTVDGTPLQLCIIAKIASISSSNCGFFQYTGAGGTFELLVPNTTYKVVSEPNPVQAVWGSSVQNVACLMAGDCNGATATSCGISVNGGTQVTNTGSMTGAGLKKTSALQIGKDGAVFADMEVAAWWVTKVRSTATQRMYDAIYAHNIANTPL